MSPRTPCPLLAKTAATRGRDIARRRVRRDHLLDQAVGDERPGVGVVEQPVERGADIAC